MKEKALTVVLSALLLPLPRLLGVMNQPLSFVDGVVFLSLIERFLQRLSMVYPVEYTREESRVSGDL
jgi:hypothetical protein